MEARTIADGEYVSQYVSRESGKPEPRNRPRPKDQDSLSVILGQVGVATAYRFVRRYGSATPDDGVRFARVGQLRERGFSVSHTPNRRNPLHASVRYRDSWDVEVSVIFDSCFSDIVWFEEGDQGD